MPGIHLPSLGQGTCYFGENIDSAGVEKGALLRGFSLGMNLVDTAEMYGEGGSELLIGDILRGGLARRRDIIIMTKVCPRNAAHPVLQKSCDNSLKRLGVEYIDVYLLHWRDENVSLAETVRGMEDLARAGKILRWGVSNFDVADMEELFSQPGGENCSVNQVLYHLASRGVEYDLLPWLRARGVSAVAYCPLAQGGAMRRTAPDFTSDAALGALAKKYGAGIYQIMLAFVLRNGDITAIPKAASVKHTEENARARALAAQITSADWAELDAAYPPPSNKMHLDMD